MAARKTESVETFDAFSAANPAAFKEGYERLTKGMAGLADLNKAALEAMMSSARVLSRGTETASADTAAFLKTSFEEGVAAMRAAAAAKSLQEAIDVQSGFLRESISRNLAQVGKVSEHWVSTTREAAEPLTACYGDFVELMQSYRP